MWGRQAVVEEPSDSGALSPLADGCSRTPSPAGVGDSARGALGLSRQRVNYHLRAPRTRGSWNWSRSGTPRLRRANAADYSRGVCGGPGGAVVPTKTGFTGIADRYASEHLVGVAAEPSGTWPHAGAAERSGTRLLTFTLEAEIRL